TELDKLYEYDYAMLDSLDRASAVLPTIREAADPKAFEAAVKSMRDAITSFESAWKSRTNAVTGIQVRCNHDPNRILPRRRKANGPDGAPQGRPRRPQDTRPGPPD